MPIAVEPIVFQPQWKDSGKLALACVSVRAKHDLNLFAATEHDEETIETAQREAFFLYVYL